MTNRLPLERLQEQLEQGAWEPAISALREVGPAAGATFLMGVPFEQQRALFRKLPVDFAAKLIGHFPYYHAYVLLHAPAPGATGSRRKHELY